MMTTSQPRCASDASGGRAGHPADHVYTAHPGEPAHVGVRVPGEGVDARGARSDHFHDGALATD
jgi:hypothetical protein